MPRLVVCLPCYNEAQALPSLLVRLAQAGAALPRGWEIEVLVVDDGSSDATASLAAPRSGVHVHLLRHDVNQGLGRTLADGLAWCCAQYAAGDVVAVMDADLTHPPEMLAALLHPILSGSADVVIASRYAPGGSEQGLPLRRLLYSRLANRVLQALARVPGVRDYTCGYRLYSVDALQAAGRVHGDSLIKERGFTCTAELLLKLAGCGARCQELGFALDYSLKAGASKMNVPATIRRYALLSLRLLVDPGLKPRQRG